MKALKAVIANDFITGNLQLTEVEYKTFMLLVSCIRHKEVLSAENWYSFSIETYMELAELSRKAAYEAVRLAATKLLSRKCIIEDDKYTIICHLVSEIKIESETSKVYARFSPSLFPYISELRDRFTYIDLQESFLLKNPQICSFYNFLLLSKWNKRQKYIEISLVELYDILSVPLSYRSYKEFNKHILSKSIAQFKNLGLCMVRVKQVKEGRATVKLHIYTKWEEDILDRELGDIAILKHNS